MFARQSSSLDAIKLTRIMRFLFGVVGIRMKRVEGKPVATLVRSYAAYERHGNDTKEQDDHHYWRK